MQVDVELDPSSSTGIEVVDRVVNACQMEDEFLAKMARRYALWANS